MSVLQKQEAEIKLNGGMNSTEGAEYQSVETLRYVLDLRINADGEYEKRPASTPVTASVPSGSAYGSVSEISGIYSRGTEVFGVTKHHGVARLDGSSIRYCRRHVDHATAQDANLRYCPVATSVTRRAIDRIQATKDQISIISVASAIYNNQYLVTAHLTIDDQVAANNTLRVVVRDVVTGVVHMEEQTVSLGAQGYLADISAVELTESGKEGVLITAGTFGAPCTITAYRWSASTNDLISVGALTTNATTTRHTLASSVAGRFYFGYEDNTSGFMKVEDRNTTAITTTHTATHGSSGGIAIVKGTSATIIASSDDTGANDTLYAETLGNPGSVTTLRTTAGEILQRVSAALETHSGYTNACVVYCNGFDSTSLPGGVVPVYAADNQEYVSYHFVTFDAAAPVDRANGYLNNVRCLSAFTVDTRAHGLFVVNPNRNSWPRPTSLVIARASSPTHSSTYSRHDAVARIVHERHAEAIGGFTAGKNVTVVGTTAHVVSTGDQLPDAQGWNVQSLFWTQVSFAEKPMPRLDAQSTALFGGGLVSQYDGQVASECQPLDKPSVYLKDTGAGAGALTGTLSVIALYTFVDANGNLHRSAPSEAVAITLAAARYDIYVSAQPFSAYDGATMHLYAVDVYATPIGGTTYHRLQASSTSKLYYTSLTAKNQFFKFVTAPAGVTSNDPLYSDGASGSERPSTPPPAFASMWRTGDIIWGLDAEDRTRVWHTKPIVSGFAPEWCNLNTVTIGDNGVGGEDVGGVSTVFAERGIWQIFGSGPNAVGGGSFDVPRRLPHEIETLDSLSICKTSYGVLFRSRQGVRLLDNGLAIQPVGAPIDASMTAQSADTYCRIANHENMSEAHVIDFGGTHFVLNLEEGKWVYWDQSSRYWADAIGIAGHIYWLQRSLASGSDSISVDYLQTDTDDYKLNTDGWILQTPWIKFDGVTGRMRVRELVVQIRLGDPVADANDFSIVYETRDGQTETFTFTSSDFVALGSGGYTADLRCHIRNQRTKSFRVTMTDVAGINNYTSATPIAMRVIYAVMPKGDRKKNVIATKGST